MTANLERKSKTYAEAVLEVETLKSDGEPFE